MKNVIEIDLTKDCSCDLVSNIDDGTNSITLVVKCDVSLNPKLVIDDGEIKLTSNSAIYTIPESKLIGTSSIIFNLADDNHTGSDFTITKSNSSGNLYLKYISDFSYELKAIKKSSTTSIDMSNYYNKNEVDSLIKNINIGNYYNKSEVDDLINGIEIPEPSLNYYSDTKYFAFEGNDFYGKAVAVTEKLKAGTWLMNFRVRAFNGVPAGHVGVCVGSDTITSNNFGFEHSSVENSSDVGSFASIVQSDSDFVQNLHIGITGLTEDMSSEDLSGVSSTFSVIVDAVKIA